MIVTCVSDARRVRFVMQSLSVMNRETFIFPEPIGRIAEGQLAHIDKLEVRAWDVAEHLETEEDVAAYLGAALGDIVRVKGMTPIAREAGLGCESLYKALSIIGNPEFDDPESGAGA